MFWNLIIFGQIFWRWWALKDTNEKRCLPRGPSPAYLLHPSPSISGSICVLRVSQRHLPHVVLLHAGFWPGMHFSIPSCCPLPPGRNGHAVLCPHSLHGLCYITFPSHGPYLWRTPLPNSKMMGYLISSLSPKLNIYEFIKYSFCLIMLGIKTGPCTC